MPVDVLDWLMGPNGGIMALSFGSGAMAGFAFATRICSVRIEALRCQVQKLSRRVEALTKEVHAERELGEEKTEELLAYLRRASTRAELLEAAKILGHDNLLHVAPNVRADDVPNGDEGGPA